MIAARWRLGLSAALMASLTAVLTACGGGGGQIEPFRPTRMLSFGDELSYISPAGQKHSINDFKRAADGSLLSPLAPDCTLQPIWTQSMAAAYGLVLAACNPDNLQVTTAVYAQPGAKVADLRTQIDQHLANGTVGPKDLITVYAGQNDVLEQYARYPATTEQQIRDELASRGRALADQVNRLANANGRILVLTINNLGESPFGQAQKAANTDTDRAALLTRMSESFNSAMRLRLLNDGRLIGLVLSDEAVSQAYRFPSAFSVANVTTAACNVALPDCNVNTLVTDANASTWLFADATRVGPVGHRRLYEAAVARSSNNPF